MILKFVGLFFVGLAILGASLPILPTTPFLLVAAACFAKSSPRLHNKLLNNRVFGQLIKDWQEHRSISLKSKVISLLTMFVTVLYSCMILPETFYKILVVLLIIGPAIFIARLPIAPPRIK